MGSKRRCKKAAYATVRSGCPGIALRVSLSLHSRFGRIASMKLGRIALALAGTLLLSAGSALAQFSIYGTVQGTRIGDITCTVSSGCASNDGKVRPFGGSFGASYDFRTYGPARVGFDVRGSVLSANKRADNYQGGAGVVRAYTALGGAHASFGIPIHALRPYVAVAGGLARSNIVGLPLQSYGEVEGFAGADLDLIPSFSIRLIEVSAGELFGPSNHSEQSIGIGLVVHFSH